LQWRVRAKAGPLWLVQRQGRVKGQKSYLGADPAEINTVMTVLLLWVLVVYVTLVYAPIRRPRIAPRPVSVFGAMRRR
jgi:hypothetical protein